MQFLFTDETNTTANIDAGVKFFVYGGLIVPSDKMGDLHDGIKTIRAKYGFNKNDSLKFDTRTRPSQVGLDSFTKAKGEVVDLCIAMGCKFIAYVVLHAIARGQQDTYIAWGADVVIEKFNKYLSKAKQRGVVVVDRLANKGEYAYLAKKFSMGLTYPKKNVLLDNIILFSSTCNNASHASSAMDIVLGSFRYCINSPRNLPAAKIMMEKMSKLIWADTAPDGNLIAFEKGLVFRPISVSIPEYKLEYDNLLKEINALLE